MAPKKKKKKSSNPGRRGSNSSNILEKVRNSLEDAAAYEQTKSHATILFADLVGSTEFKRDHTPEQGFRKTVAHNDLVSTVIGKHGGEVVKYIGDEVMGIFHGESSEAPALACGLEILESIREFNQDQNWSFPLEMSSKIGIHSGPVWFFKYDSIDDPQGTTVDIAARVTSLSIGGRLLCTEEAFERASAIRRLSNCSDSFRTYVKGIKDPIELRALAENGTPPNHPYLVGELGGSHSLLDNDLRQAIEAKERGDDSALEKLKHIVAINQGDFHANLHAADLLIKAVNGSLAPDVKSQLEEAREFLCRAKWARRRSSRVWLLLSWVSFKLFEFDPNNSETDLNNAISYAQESLGFAEDGLNVVSAIQAKTFLAQYLRARARHKSISSPHASREDLAKASEYCAEVEGRLDGSYKNYRAECFATHALVMLELGVDPDKIREKIDRALDADPLNLHALDAQKELSRRLGRGTGPNI